ncbi:piezo-type mechanosensitive ion channel homolog [Gastrolobium bilobum]|uniref:piezo-type mechanosensitive ion channel homolog n=1 Tax=Gastrolobium bilobum TaxID=150636 RepID=UPI002AB001D4|nr:piezo-type mechanosensitive ion channel homolog [Gastrolobium bilobum]
MARFIPGFVLPMLLLTASILNWSLISLVDLIAFLLILYTAPRKGPRFRQQPLISWSVLILSSLTLLSHAIFHIVLAIEGDQWSTTDAQWAQLIGFIRVQSWRTLPIEYFLVMQVLATFLSLIEIYGNRFGQDACRNFHSGHLCSSVLLIGSHLKGLCCLLLPAVQLIAGISHASWVSLPFFVCSSIGLVDWSWTSNYLGIFRWWRYLLFYAGFNIILLYIYQLPIEFPETFRWIFCHFGLFKLSTKSEWSEVCSGLSLLLFYIMLSWIRSDLVEMEIVTSTRESDLTEQLLPKKHSHFVHESRSSVRHINFLLRGAVSRSFTINFLTYGFPISLLALSLWSFHFASLCSFGLLAYVGYIFYAFPSMFRLHQLNGVLLVFILVWAASTYIFNVAFTVSKNKLWKEMEIWETIGLWHYPIPGYYLLAQFGLGFLVAMCNLVTGSVLLCITDQGQLKADESVVEDEEETTVLVVATIAWGLRKCSHAVVLILIFLIAIRPGLIHAVYMIFFLIYLLSHAINCKLRQAIILLCEAQFALQFILQLDLISKTLDQKGSYVLQILSQLGLLNHIYSVDFFKISILACFCAIHNHGLQTLLLFSAIVRHTSCRPVGFSILRACLNKPVRLSGYSPRSSESQETHERKTISYLNIIRQNFLSVYRSCGKYIAFLTVLLSVYLCTPNYASFGYLFFLLLWISGRQLAGKTRKHLWYPMKVYAVMVFVSIYSIGVFSSSEMWFPRIIDLQTLFGYNPAASMLQNIWESLAVLVVMQLYSYERRQSKSSGSSDYDAPEIGPFAFTRRLLVRHTEKILSLALFYASLSPISAFGFLYLLGLINCSRLPKSSQIPAKVFLVYSGLLIMVEYLFQMWGDQAEMFPGQEHSQLSLFMGLQLYKPGFKGLESGLRGKVVVIIACILQYNVFRWLEKMHHVSGNGRTWNELCPLFNLVEVPNETIACTPQSKQSENPTSPTIKRGVRSRSWPTVNSALSQEPDSGLERESAKKFRHFHFWESSKDSFKWNRKRILFLRKERFEMQKTVLKVSLKFWIENMFNLFGLEINMIVLLLASFAVLNAISLLYIASLAACVLLHRLLIKKLWPVFVFLFASIITVEYVAIWMHLAFTNQQIEEQVPCHDCWRVSDIYFSYCKKCWLGIIVDDPRMLISYYGVFMFSCFKFRADQSSSLTGLELYQKILSQWKSASVLSDLSFETKGYWTFLDHLRLYGYCHLLDFVLSLILITGTLEYDILHLGYLGFALIFFRMRLKILKQGNKIFRFLRMYNFVLIVFSLAYQSPFVGDLCAIKRGSIECINELVGFHKYDYGFRITSRSAFVEIIIFLLVALQSYMFSFPEFDYVSKYLEKEQIGAILRQQEKKAAWKTAQLRHIRKAEELKHLRSLQVEKMKSEMLNLQNQLHNMSTDANCSNASLEIDGLRERGNSSLDFHGGNDFRKQDLDIRSTASIGPFHGNQSHLSEKSVTSLVPECWNHPMDSHHGIVQVKERIKSNDFWDLENRNRYKLPVRKNALVSAIHFIGNGVSQVQSLGNMAVNNLMNYLKIENEELESTKDSSEDEEYYEIENQNMGAEPLEPTFSTHSVYEHTVPDTACLQIGIIFRYMWSRMRSNNDVVCYCCFILIYLWHFSLLSVVYLAALYLYALCQNTGPSYIFWVIMLIYTEVCILLQYLYQIIIQHTAFEFRVSLLQELGFPAKKTTSSFVTSNLPFFLIYIFTLLQTSITVKDGGWTITADLSFCKRRNQSYIEDVKCSTCQERLQRLFLPLKNILKVLIRSLCRYWKSLTWGAETPPYFVQLSMEVNSWPKEGIQPKRIESRINKLLKILHYRRCKEENLFNLHSASRIRIQSIEKSEENENLCFVVLEVLFASPPIEFTAEERYRSLTPASDVSNEIRKAQHVGIFKEIGFPYRILSVIGGGKREIDLYAYIFGADLAVFFLVAIFYESIMKANSEFLEVYQLEDQFPEDFVLVLMVIFFLIVLDRIIYLCSFATGKVIFYLFNLVLFTYSVTKYAWDMDPLHRYSGRVALRAIYLTKAISLVLQATQLHFGIPHKSTLYRQFLTSSVSRINFLGFRLYRALPFLYELRCVLDWSCTTTSLTMYDWLKLEDIHASLFLVKCDVDLNRASHQHGQKQTKMTKFCNGICLFFVLLCVMWAPMLMYSSGNPTNIANPIKDASARVDIKTLSGRLTLFETTLCEKISWEKLEARTTLDPQGYLSAYDEKDIQLICCQSDASTLWLVPPVVQARFLKSLSWNMDITFSWEFTRDRPKGKEVVKYELTIQDQDLPESSEVTKVFNGTSNSFTVFNIYPRYFRVTGSGDVRFLEQSVELVSGDLVLNRGDPEWWSFYDIDISDVHGCGKFPGPMAIVVSEETPQGILGETLSKFSIWGLYITFVLAVGRFIRLQCSDLRMRIPFENLPSCDRLMAICEDIYAARATGELEVEEALYWTLVKIYRSPHMLLEYTQAE